MRLLDLQLIAYGPFTDQQVDLSGGQHGLHLVYGANEAGKSAALRSLPALLFGFGARVPDAFVHDYPKLRVGARIRAASGEELEFVRKKAQKGTLLKPGTGAGAYPDAVLAPFLGGATEELFRRVFGIDHQELREGGNALQALNGLLGDALLTAGAGGPVTREALAALEEEAGEIYQSAKNRKCHFRSELAKYNAAYKRQKQAAVPSSRWDKLRGERNAVERERDGIRDQLKELRTNKARLSRLQSSLGFIVQRDELEAELEAMKEVAVLPLSYAIDERRECQRALASATETAERVARELDGEDGIRARMGDLAIPEGLLEHTEAIMALHRRIEDHEKAKRDLPKRESERTSHEKRARGIMRELDSALPWEEVETLRLSPDRKRRIQDLGTEQQLVTGRPGALGVEVDTLEREIAARQQELASVEKQRPHADLERALARAQKRGDLDELIARARTRAADAADEAARGLRALGLWQGTLEELAALPLPSAETTELYQRDLDALEAEIGRLHEREVELRERAARAARRIATLQRAGEVPDEDELASAREERDRGWGLVRAVWLDGDEEEDRVSEFAGDRPLADAYEASVTGADHVADRLRRGAMGIAELARELADQEECEKQLASLGEEDTALDGRRNEVREKWAAEWAAAGIATPRTPREMLAWLRKQTEVVKAAEEARSQQRELERLQEVVSTHRAEIEACLAELAEPAPSREEGLEAVVERCLELIARMKTAGQDRERLHREISALEDRRAQTGQELERATADLAEWQRGWNEAVAAVGCRAGASAAEANSRIEHIEQLFAELREMHDRQDRIDKMQLNVTEFEGDVLNLCERVAPDLAAVEAQQAAAILDRRLRSANEDAATLKALRAQEEDKARALRDAEEEADKAARRLEELCELAGVETSAALQAAEERSHEVTSRRDRVQQLEASLRELAGGMSLEELISRAQGRDADALQAELLELDEQIDALDKERSKREERVGELRTEMATIDGSGAAAEADEEAIGVLSRLRELAARYLRVRLAAAVLRQQIDLHASAHQDPFLARAGELFSRLTGGRYTGLGEDSDDKGNPIVVGMRPAGREPLRAQQMSDGTRDQLYLSLRIAYLEKRLDGAEPLPFVVDDILVNFDDDRSLATFEVLGELAKSTQVIYFTHHEHLIDLLERAVPAGDRFVQRLPGPA